MTEMLLFGAGASKEAGIPTTYELTNKIAEEFRNQSDLQRHSHVVSFVLGGLLFNQGIRGSDPLTSGVNVEEFFNAIQLLADRNTLEASPFVGSWHYMVEEFDKIQPPAPHAKKLQEIIFKSITDKIFSSIPNTLPAFGARDIDDALKKAISRGDYQGFSFKSVGNEIGEFVVAILKRWTQQLSTSRLSGNDFERAFRRAIDQTPRPGGGMIFREVADMMIQMLAKFVIVADAGCVNYLGALKNLLKSQRQLTIASLNYDNCVELFCEKAKLRYDTGIDEWSKSGVFDMEDEGILLLKLHGSIDWKSEDGQSADRPMPHRIIKRVSLEEVQKEGHWPAVIFGHRNKLTAEGPFLDLLRAFQRELAKADRLTIVGYSFADVHINTYLSHWLNQDSKHRLRIVDPHFDNLTNIYIMDLKELAAKQIEVRNEPASKALKTLFETT